MNKTDEQKFLSKPKNLNSLKGRLDILAKQKEMEQKGFLKKLKRFFFQ